MNEYSISEKVSLVLTAQSIVNETLIAAAKVINSNQSDEIITKMESTVDDTTPIEEQTEFETIEPASPNEQLDQDRILKWSLLKGSLLFVMGILTVFNGEIVVSKLFVK